MSTESATESPASRIDPESRRIPPRIMACVICQQRKVKCDKSFPCKRCLKSQVQCVAATPAPYRRRRHFPERDLLAQFQRYEGLLRQHKIKFEALPSTEIDVLPKDGDVSKEGTVNIWNAMNQRSSADDDDDVREAAVKKTWDQVYQNNDHLLFGTRTNLNLWASHPKPAQIIKLWQVYLENVSPLLKVTHNPTLQSSIIDATSDLASIDPKLEALMFSIYCVSIQSLTDGECQRLFSSPREEILRKYQSRCQQALLNCGCLRSNAQDSLTALYLYLVSVVNDTDPRSLSATLGVAIRIAMRMGIHNEATNEKYTSVEAELRRRLWWSLVLFDNRICELSQYKSPTLAHIWDCNTPSNVNDFDIGMEKSMRPTEAIFAVVRAEIGQSIRQSPFHARLDTTNPSLKGGVDGSDDLERLEVYLRYCNSENPLHLMTIWTTRGAIAKNRLYEYYTKGDATDAQRDLAVSYALTILECDTRIMASPLTQGYRWYLQFHFPAPAYFHILEDLRRRPTRKHTERAWGVMSENSKARLVGMERYSPLFKVFSKIIVQAWEACEGQGLSVPGIVSAIKERQDTGDVTSPALPEMTEMMDVDMDQLEWSLFDWNPISTY